jgi:hypothetical protein
MEFTSNIHDVEVVEREIINKLIRKGQAKFLKDTSYIMDENGRRIRVDNKFYTKKVILEKEYNVYVGVAWQFAIEQVYVRFWYDRRNDTAGIKMTMEGFMLVANSVTVTSLLKELNERITTNGNKDIDLDKISQVMKTAIKMLDKEPKGAEIIETR